MFGLVRSHIAAYKVVGEFRMMQPADLPSDVYARSDNTLRTKLRRKD